MDKTIKILLICMLSIICIILGLVMAFLIKNDAGSVNLGSFINFSIDSNYNMNVVDSYEAEPESVNKLYMNLKSTDIEIKESTNGKILAEYYSNVDTDFKFEYKDNTISLDEEKEQENHVFFNSRRKVVMYVPNTYEGEFELILSSGDTKSEIDLSNNKVSISTQSGDISLKSVGESDIKTSSGDIVVDSANTSKIVTSSGDIVLNKINKTTSIITSSGDIVINTLNIDENSNITTSSGDVVIRSNECNCYIDTETSSGDAKINKSDRKSDIVLKIKTSSGDIVVETI